MLPKAHTRAVYSVSWSARSGRIASCGGDGKVVVYEEREVEGSTEEETKEVVEGEEAGEEKKEEGEVKAPVKKTEWVIIAEVEGAHGVHEINSVLWSRRWDKDGKGENDEVLLTAGDDGVVNVYTIE